MCSGPVITKFLQFIPKLGFLIWGCFFLARDRMLGTYVSSNSQKDEKQCAFVLPSSLMHKQRIIHLSTVTHFLCRVFGYTYVQCTVIKSGIYCQWYH